LGKLKFDSIDKVMRFTLVIIFVFTAILGTACGGSGTKPAPEKPAANAPVEAKKPEDGFYQGKGKVTKINNDLGSVELDHEAIEGLMPAMKMEFNVKDKAMLKPIAVGDAVTFTVEYKQGTEIIIAIGK